MPGCTAWYPVHKIEKTPEKPSVQAYYDYPAPDFSAARVVSEKREKHYTLKTVEFPFSRPEDLKIKDEEEYRRKNEELFKTDQKTSNDLALRYTVRIDYYIPNKLKPGEKKPAILISPILGGNIVVDHFARYYAGRGYLAAIVYRKRLFWDDARGQDAQQFEDYMRSSVIRLRQAVDWLTVQPEVDPERIGSFGISYGAILHTALAAVEPRVRYFVLAMPAGPLPEVILNCPDKGVSKLTKYAREHYGWSDEKILSELRRVLKTDPMLLAPHVPREKVQVYVAAFDRVVGAKRSFALWKVLGKPELKILPFGHYGGVALLPYLQTKSYRALKKHLK